MSDPVKPTGPVSEEQLKESGLEWVICGGISVGMTVYPTVWRLRYKDENLRIAQRTKDLQMSAALARENADLKERLAKFIS